MHIAGPGPEARALPALSPLQETLQAQDQLDTSACRGIMPTSSLGRALPQGQDTHGPFNSVSLAWSWGVFRLERSMTSD